MKLPKKWLENNQTSIMTFMVFLLLLLMVCMTRQHLRSAKRESFAPGRYPSAYARNLLSGWYKGDKFCGPDNLSYAASSKNYPVFPSAYCGTNNLRHWRRPMNGTCAPAPICTPLYKGLKLPEPQDPGPPQSTSDQRVNYYVSTIREPS